MTENATERFEYYKEKFLDSYQLLDKYKIHIKNIYISYQILESKISKIDSTNSEHNNIVNNYLKYVQEFIDECEEISDGLSYFNILNMKYYQACLAAKLSKELGLKDKFELFSQKVIIYVS